MSPRTVWYRAFDWYFLSLNYVVWLVQAFFMIRFMGFEVLFTILFSILWLSFPTFNFMFLISSENFKYNFLQSNMWAVWFCMMSQLGFIFLNWQLFQGDFANYFDLYTDAKTVTVTLLELMFYLIQSVFFILYAKSLATDMSLSN